MPPTRLARLALLPLALLPLASGALRARPVTLSAVGVVGRPSSCSPLAARRQLPQLTARMALDGADAAHAAVPNPPVGLRDARLLLRPAAVAAVLRARWERFGLGRRAAA
eukprot:7030382-Prymnesium_polylepis.1